MCEMSKRVRAVYKELPEEAQSVIDDLWTEWEYESMEASYYMAVVEGEWPNSDEIIESIRRKNRLKKDVQKAIDADLDWGDC